VSGPSSLLRPHHPVRRAGLHSTARHADLEIDAVYLATGANDPPLTSLPIVRIQEHSR
jgi:hypothetical protein